VKEFKVSPDGVMQMAIQLAYTRLHKQTVSVYGSSGAATPSLSFCNSLAQVRECIHILLFAREN
jgi:hypothetical protein